MTKDGSLSRWFSMGNLERELDIYKNLCRQNIDVGIVSFDINDKKFSKLIYPIKVYPLRGGSSNTKLFQEARKKYKKILMLASIYKTNQVKGSELAIRLGKNFNKPIIVRSGYLPSLHPQPGDEKFINKIEEKALINANLFFVSSLEDKQYLQKKYPIFKEKIKVVPNYVNIKIFKPRSIKKRYDIIYIGRGSKQKNLMLLLKALLVLRNQNIQIKTLMIGNCNQKEDLVTFAEKNGLGIEWKGGVPSKLLPHYLNQAKLFILPSKYEGHPKALLEAMSCGLMCVGMNVVGVKEVIDHKKNGFLSPQNPRKLAQLILELLKNKRIREYCGHNARKKIVNYFSLEKIMKKEISLYNILQEK